MISSGARTKMLQNQNYFENLINLFGDYSDYFVNTIELVRIIIFNDYFIHLTLGPKAYIS